MSYFRNGHQAWVFFVEFDRKNIVTVIGPDVYYLDTFVTGNQQAHLGRFDSHLYGFYHPFRVVDEGWTWMTRPFWRKRVGKNQIYSPHRTLKMTEHVKRYKDWLKAYAEPEWERRDAKQAAKQPEKKEVVYFSTPLSQAIEDIIRPTTPAAQQMQMELATPSVPPEQIAFDQARDFWAQWDADRNRRIREEDELR